VDEHNILSSQFAYNNHNINTRIISLLDLNKGDNFVFTFVMIPFLYKISSVPKDFHVHTHGGWLVFCKFICGDFWELSWWWSYGSCIYNYLCSQCLSPLTLWVPISFRWGVLDTTLCDKDCQWLVAGWWFSPSTPVSSTNQTERHHITEILLKVALNTITLTLNPVQTFITH
jgi:hypothetical protein